MDILGKLFSRRKREVASEQKILREPTTPPSPAAPPAQALSEMRELERITKEYLAQAMEHAAWSIGAKTKRVIEAGADTIS